MPRSIWTLMGLASLAGFASFGAPVRGLAAKRSSRSRFGSKTELPLEVWLQNGAPARALPMLCSTQPSQAQCISCFAFSNTVPTVIRQLCLCIVLTSLSFLRNHCTALHLSLHTWSLRGLASLASLVFRARLRGTWSLRGLASLAIIFLREASEHLESYELGGLSGIENIVIYCTLTT